MKRLTAGGIKPTTLPQLWRNFTAGREAQLLPNFRFFLVVDVSHPGNRSGRLAHTLHANGEAQFEERHFGF